VRDCIFVAVGLASRAKLAAADQLPCTSSGFGCATILDETTQTVAVQSIPSGAACHLQSLEGQWDITTPTAVTVERSGGAINVTCHDGAAYHYPLSTTSGRPAASNAPPSSEQNHLVFSCQSRQNVIL
jgi:spore coat protein U-like protein